MRNVCDNWCDLSWQILHVRFGLLRRHSAAKKGARRGPRDVRQIIFFKFIYLKAFSITPKTAWEWLFWGKAPTSTNYSKSSKYVLGHEEQLVQRRFCRCPPLRLNGILIAESLVCSGLPVFSLQISLREVKCLAGESARKPT